MMLFFLFFYICPVDYEPDSEIGFVRPGVTFSATVYKANVTSLSVRPYTK